MDNFDLLLDRDDLADLLKISRKKLNYILFGKGVDNFYTSFEIPKKNGSMRVINAPNASLKYLQRTLANEIWLHEVNVWKDKISERNISHAFEKKKSIVTNAKIHRNKRYILNYDLEDFFGTFHFGRVLGFFEKNRDFKFPHKLAVAVTQLVCYNGALPQGAPTSPIITNLICQIFDYRVLRLAKKYKMDYTRYADDLTFSTNDKLFINRFETFNTELHKLLSYLGFNINETKTRFIHRTSRQQVTGITVNSKLSVSKEYYKDTRAMAHHLYKNGEFSIHGQSGTINQLEGRFAFINHIDRCNAPASRFRKECKDFSSKEREYQKFIFYKYFYINNRPLLVTEGETDVAYIKAALKKHFVDFPALVAKNADDKYEFKIEFFHRTRRVEYYLGIVKDGADAIQQIYNFYTGEGSCPNLSSFFKKITKSKPNQPVILLFDNELENSNKPLKKFINRLNLKDGAAAFKRDLSAHLQSNLFLTTNHLVKGLQECEIEDLFNDSTLAHQINGKTFSRNSKADNATHYGKSIFANYIADNFDTIDFTEFLPYLRRIQAIITGYNNDSIE